ncbi:hypothetical protein ANN_13826 [Periplaneta americana]|uniref:Uncharacterized protein n=1 Tax=Periplaneta americana TaxID=6978 RepID=A0ABQ8SW63_PERAM|nr:hypothetical protein ANN_13826 [Periplaneta americana]
MCALRQRSYDMIIFNGATNRFFVWYLGNERTKMANDTTYLDFIEPSLPKTVPRVNIAYCIKMSKRKVFSFEDKANIISDIERGLSQADVGRQHSLSKATSKPCKKSINTAYKQNCSVPAICCTTREHAEKTLSIRTHLLTRGHSIIVWNCFSLFGLCPIVPAVDKLNAASYNGILDNSVQRQVNVLSNPTALKKNVSDIRSPHLSEKHCEGILGRFPSFPLQLLFHYYLKSVIVLSNQWFPSDPKFTGSNILKGDKIVSMSVFGKGETAQSCIVVTAGKRILILVNGSWCYKVPCFAKRRLSCPHNLQGYGIPKTISTIITIKHIYNNLEKYHKSNITEDDSFITKDSRVRYMCPGTTEYRDVNCTTNHLSVAR